LCHNQAADAAPPAFVCTVGEKRSPMCERPWLVILAAAGLAVVTMYARTHSFGQYGPFSVDAPTDCD